MPLYKCHGARFTFHLVSRKSEISPALLEMNYTRVAPRGLVPIYMVLSRFDPIFTQRPYGSTNIV